MQAHRIETTIQPGGALAVHGLPVPEGAHVEVIVLVKDEPATMGETAQFPAQPARAAHPLRGTPYQYDEPFEAAVPATEWEAGT